jgi:YbbR domain-containing protein
VDWSPSESPSAVRGVFRFFTHNGWLKLISLIFAIVLYMIVRSEQVREYSKVARVKIITAANVMVVGSPERAIDVTVRLPNTLFSQPPSDEQLVGVLDVSPEKIGKLRVKVTKENFPNLDKRYRLVIPDPSVEIELDHVIRKRVAVRAVLQGPPPEGLEVEKVIVEPSEVEVVGAQRELSKVEMLSTSPINIQEIDKNFSVITKLVLEDFSSMKVNDDKINVQVIVGQKKAMKLFRGIPIEVLSTEELQIRPASIDIELQGQKEVIDALKSTDVRAFVDASRLESGWQERKVLLKIPPNTSLVSVNPDQVSVQLVK